MKNEIWIANEAAGLAGADAQRSPLLDAKVMMVDDEPLMTALIEGHLEDAGYTNFVSTNDPREALEMVRREEPGVLLLDLMMPQLSGFDVLQAIRADEELRYTPVIVLTAAAGADARLRALQLGASDFLSKPVDESELVLRMRNTLALRQYTQRLINRDAVTDLPNAKPFLRGIGQALARGHDATRLMAVMSVEIADMRQLAESLGPTLGDELARWLARRLQHCAEAEAGLIADVRGKPGQALAARLEADRFGLLIERLSDVEHVEAAARRLLAELSEPVKLGTHELAPAVWIGIAVAGTDGDDAASLRQSADLAASHARQTGLSPVQFASHEISARSRERLTLGSQLRGATQRGELRLHYQPKVTLADNRIVGAEALVRWQHPEHGLLPPGRFIGLAEEFGLITAIGEWVAEQACRDAAAWAAAGHAHVRVAINVSKLQFQAGDLCQTLRRALFDAGLPPQRLVVELTESMLMDDTDNAIRLMQSLKGLGLTLSIDDFGTGYSSLSYLKRFPLDELKIDQSFVKDLPGSPADVAIVRSVVDLGHNLGMSVIAEGVETEAQRESLRALGCDRMQGFLFSRPVPMDDFLALLSRPAGPG
jgi:predicted signal transduction protein with EAL and GGDEF domain